MADWYFNTSTGNDTTGDGSSGTPYATAQKCWDEASTGDTIYGCGTDTGGINWGTTSKQRLSIIGCDSSWVVGGAQLVIDGGNSLTNLLWNATTSDGAKYGLARYCTLKRSTGSVIGGANGAFDSWTWDKCIFESCGSDAFPRSSTLYRGNQFTRCIFRNNSGAAINRTGTSTICVACRFSGNSGGAIISTYSPYDVMVHCLFDDNGSYIWNSGWASESGNPLLIFGCTGDENTHGIRCYGKYAGGGPLILFNRLTHTTGTALDVTQSTRRAIVGGNYFHGNGTDLNSARVIEIEDSLYAQAADGYENQATGDFNLADDALMRSIELALDWDV